jgi:hypothetical protein
VNGSVVVTGKNLNRSQWYHVELYVKVADSGGIIQTRIDGILDCNYSGDTKPGAGTTITGVEIANASNGQWVRTRCFDDLAVKDNGWPGDVRFDAALVPLTDTVTVEWDCSTGVDHRALVDEVPPVTTDYVYTAVNGERDLYELSNWTGSGKTPQFLTQWHYGYKDTADAQQVKQLLISNAVESLGAACNVPNGAYLQLWRVLTVNPDGGGAWNESVINVLQIGQEAVVP